MAKAVVAVIEGDPAVAVLMDELLTEDGFQTHVWPESQGATQFVRTLSPDIVILDLWLRERGDGWGVLVQLRQDRWTRSIPVIVCSGDTQMLQERDGASRAYQCEQLVKPFAMVDLLSLVQAATAGTTAPQRHVGQGMSLLPTVGRQGVQNLAIPG